MCPGFSQALSGFFMLSARRALFPLTYFAQPAPALLLTVLSLCQWRSHSAGEGLSLGWASETPVELLISLYIANHEFCVEVRCLYFHKALGKSVM